jgi:hypothetical protein
MPTNSSSAQRRPAVRHRAGSTNALMVLASVTGVFALGIAVVVVVMGYLP